MINLIKSYKFKYYALPFFGGLLYASGFPGKVFPQFFGSSIVGMFLLLATFEYSFVPKEDSIPLKRQLLSLLSFSFGYYFLGYYWIPYTFSEFGGIVFPFNQLLGMGFPFIIVPQLLVFVLAHRVLTSFKFKTSFVSKSIPLKNLSYAFALTLLEYYIPQQFPAHLGHPWLQLSPHLGLTPYLGAPGYSFFSYWIILSLIGFKKTKVIDPFAIGGLLIFITLNLVIPLNPKDPERGVVNTNIRMVQANIGNYMKVLSEKGDKTSVREVFQRYLDLSSLPSEKKLDLIIWPETAYPNVQQSHLLKDNMLPPPKLIQDIITQTGAELFTGGYDSSPASDNDNFESEYNAALHFNKYSELQDVYHKIRLIPFGESLPFGPFNKYLSRYINNIAYFAQGEHFPLFKTSHGARFISAICYEILYSSFIKEYLNNVKPTPHFLINLTNDSWYGNTAEPYQHLFLAKWRALEFNLPIVRMTNTGISSIIYPNGTESKRTHIGGQEILDATLKTPHRNSTIFESYGLWGVTLIWLFFILLNNLFLKFRASPDSKKNLL